MSRITRLFVIDQKLGKLKKEVSSHLSFSNFHVERIAVKQHSHVPHQFLSFRALDQNQILKQTTRQVKGNRQHCIVLNVKPLIAESDG
jgi:hypothetical protein